ncbi:hypothetical protein [Capnocytophaga felis]|uniref:hypothetical protein n=1 Tax=Capnocytophaga felis TaxID=2267611 RepID=UPI0012D348AF|nr:hypothetical protein [Capnocytophaga felis]
MYKQIKKIEKVSLNNKGSKLYLYLKEEKKLVEIDSFGNIKKEITFFDMAQVYRFNITNTNFIVSFNDEKTIFYSNEGIKLLTFKKQLYFSFLEENDIYIYIYKIKIFYIDLIKKTIN